MAKPGLDPFAILAARIQAWDRCSRIPGCDKSVWRQDANGRVIRWADFGDRFSRYGWETRTCPSGTVLGRALKRYRIEAIHWRGILGGEARDGFDLSRAA